MIRTLMLLALSGCALACGAVTNAESTPDAGAGTGGSAGSAAGAGGGAGRSGAAGAAGVSGAAGADAAPDAAVQVCCNVDFDCPMRAGDGSPQSECVNGVCHERPFVFDNYAQSCWSDSDCPFGACSGAFVCGCGATCSQPDKLGQCAAPPSDCCLQQDSECADANTPRCSGGKCEAQPPVGRCWRDSDCATGYCSGSYWCPLGMACGPKSNGCENQLGDCM